MKAVEIVSIPVTDQARAKEFYLRMGFTLLTEAPFGKDQQWIQLGLPGGGASITLVTWFKEMPAGSVRGLVIGTDDIDKEVQTLINKNIKVEPVETMPWGKFASIQDPDGNRLTLHQNN
jgi:predicted enzyme related to lactoylglutathione lyase